MPLSAQTTAPAPRPVAELIALDRLVSHRDSFTVLVGGAPLGWIVGRLERTATGFRYTERTRLGGFVEQDTEVTTDLGLLPITIRQTGKVQDESTRIELVVMDGAVRGRADIPGPEGIRTVTIDTAIAPGTLDDNVLQAILPALPFGPATDLSFRAFNSGSGETRVFRLTVAGTDTVDVPAGRVPAHRIELGGGPQQVTFWVGVAPPHPLLRIVIANSPVEMVREHP